MLYFFSKETSISVKDNLVIVKFEQSASMGYSKQSYVQLLCFVIKLCFHIHTHCTCALIQYSEQWPMIK